MNFKDYIEQFAIKVREFVNSIANDAIGMLMEDINNPNLNTSNNHPDHYVLRANNIGIKLLRTGQFSSAETLFRILSKEVIKFREESGQWRHAGALIANTGVACAMQGNYDQAAAEFLRATKEDAVTYKVPAKGTFAINVLLKNYLENPVKKFALENICKTNNNVSEAHIDQLFKDLNDREYAFLAYLSILRVNLPILHEFPNDFCELQVFSGLRSLSALFEIELKLLTGDMSRTLYPTIESLYNTKSWWGAFLNAKNNQVEAFHNSNKPIDDQLRDALNLATPNDESVFWKSLLVSYIVRNYTVHQLEIQCGLIQLYSNEALSHLLNAMVYAKKYR